MDVGNESMIALAKEAFLTSGHLATNIAGINVKWETKNTAVRAATPVTWENLQFGLLV